jgi:hypothetical protein
VTARIFFGFCLFKRLQDFVSDHHRIREALQPRRELFKFVVAEVTVSDAGRQNEVIIGKAHRLAVRISNNDALLILVHARDFSQDHGCIFLVPQDSADWGPNLAGCQH